VHAATAMSENWIDIWMATEGGQRRTLPINRRQYWSAASSAAAAALHDRSNCPSVGSRSMDQWRGDRPAIRRAERRFAGTGDRSLRSCRSPDASRQSETRLSAYDRLSAAAAPPERRVLVGVFTGGIGAEPCRFWLVAAVNLRLDPASACSPLLGAAAAPSVDRPPIQPDAVPGGVVYGAAAVSAHRTVSPECRRHVLHSALPLPRPPPPHPQRPQLMSSIDDRSIYRSESAESRRLPCGDKPPSPRKQYTAMNLHADIDGRMEGWMDGWIDGFL
jgi:hypothetical protein